MVVLKALQERGEVGSQHGQVLLGMLIVQELATVLLIVLLPQLAGDASCPSVLRAVHPEHARLVVVALAYAGTTHAVVADVRRSNPTVPILARAARAQDDPPLRPARASGVVAPERAGAELLVEQALSVLRVPAA